MNALLEVRDLRVTIPLDEGVLRPVRGISFSVGKGETLCVVGESGCGKSLTSLSLMGLLPSRAQVEATTLRFAGEDLLKLSDVQMNSIRGNRMSMIFQEPMTSLNPAYTVGNQLEEAYLRHHRGRKREARERAIYLLEKVGITGAAERLGQYPHQLSGGLRQRVMIAMALMCGPQLIVADEPTTALDVTVQAQILRLLKDLQREFGMALILITHDLGVVARIADRVAVMYAGEIVETGTAHEVFGHPLHPYTQGLLDCIPIPGRIEAGQRLGSIPGIVPSLLGTLDGCAFSNRCRFAQPSCQAGQVPERSPSPGNLYRCLYEPAERQSGINALEQELPRSPGVGVRPADLSKAIPQIGSTPLLQAQDVVRSFALPGRFFGPKRTLRAVNGVNLRVMRGETLALVGESGSGKTTLARMLLGLLAPSSGQILFDGAPLSGLDRIATARRVQPIFQDPYSSLNPRKTIASIISLPLRVHGIGDAATQARAVRDMMEQVGLSPRLADVTPNQLSGGQRQRVAIARALIVKPELVICDEPTSALDVSVQSQILNLLQDLQKELGLTYLLITHNLAVVEHIATRVAVMYLGRIVEETTASSLFRQPRHPYTQALLESVLTPQPGLGLPQDRLGIAFADPMNPPSGCHFHPRCAARMDICSSQAPVRALDGDTVVECHLYSTGAAPRAAVARETPILLGT